MTITVTNNITEIAVTISSVSVDVTAIHKATAAEVSALTSKVTLVDGDVILGENSESATAFSKVKILFSSLKSSLKTYFDTVYSTLALGETNSTAFRGDRGKTAYDHSQTTHAPSDALNDAGHAQIAAAFLSVM